MHTHSHTSPFAHARSLPVWIKTLLLGSVVFYSTGLYLLPTYGAFSFSASIENNSISTGTWDDETSQTVVVRSGDLETITDRFAAATSSFSGKWFFYNDENDTINNALGSFVTGPAPAPIGLGSAQIGVTGSQRRNLATYQFKGVALADIVELKFSTYSQSAGNGSPASERSAYLNFNVSFDGTDTWQRRLIFLPAHNGAVTNDVWQQWDAATGTAMWTYSGANWPAGAVSNGSISGNTPRSWSDVLADYPAAKTLTSDSWFGFRVGEPYANGFTGNVDNFIIGIKTGFTTNTTTFDFEPDTQSSETVVVTPSDMEGWEFNRDRAAWPAGTGEMVAGPATPPVGTGSARLATPGVNDRIKLRHYLPAGTLISSIKELKYGTYRANPNGGALSPALQFDVDFTGTPVNPAKADARIVYEPYYTQQAQILDDAWQTWDALNDAAGTGTGAWWIAGAASVCPISNGCTWTELKAAYPDMRISAKSLEDIDTQGAVLFKAGGSWAGFDGNVDKLVLGIKTGSNVHTTTYDFEADPPPVPAQETVVLNEILPNPEGADDQLGAQGEWVELYNKSGSTINLTGWYVKDAAGNTRTIGDPGVTPLNRTFIAEQGNMFGAEWLVVFMNGEVLNNDGDTVYLYNAANELQDVYTYGGKTTDADADSHNTEGMDNDTPAGAETSGQEGKSDARIPDGTGAWVDPVPTPGSPNEIDGDMEAFMAWIMEQQALLTEPNSPEPPAVDTSTASSTEPAPAPSAPAGGVSGDQAPAGDAAQTPEDGATPGSQETPETPEEEPAQDDADGQQDDPVAADEAPDSAAGKKEDEPQAPATDEDVDSAPMPGEEAAEPASKEETSDEDGADEPAGDDAPDGDAASDPAPSE